MRISSTLHAALLLSAFLISTVACAQSQDEEIASLPTTLSPERLQSLEQLSSGAAPEASQPRARRRLTGLGLLLSPEELTYKLAVQKLGVNPHRFVHCDLPKGKVRTGVITDILNDGFFLKDGILSDEWISYSDLKAAPRAVPGIGTRISHGFKWAGVGLGVAALIPLLPLFWIAFHGDC